jgi:hypothetical protein
VGARCDLGGDLVEMKLHGFALAGRQYGERHRLMPIGKLNATATATITRPSPRSLSEECQVNCVGPKFSVRRNQSKVQGMTSFVDLTNRIGNFTQDYRFYVSHHKFLTALPHTEERILAY